MEICHICDDSFQDLKKHYYDKHTTSRKLYRCDACNKDNNSEIEVRKHERDFHSVHEDNKDFKCESCEKSFTQADSLRAREKYSQRSQIFTLTSITKFIKITNVILVENHLL